MSAGPVGGARASGGPRSATRSGGFLSSPEGARFGGNITAKFSSDVFAKSKPGLINTDSFSRPKASILSVNFGRESRPSHARLSSLKSRSDIINRSAIPDRVRSVTPIGLNINRGKEAHSKVARTSTLARRGMFDIARPKTPNTIVPHETRPAKPLASLNTMRVRTHEISLPQRTLRSKEARRPVQKREFFARPFTAMPRAVEVGHTKRNRVDRLQFMQRPLQTPRENVQAKPELASKVRARVESRKVKALENTVVLWRNPNIAPRVKLESVATPVVEQRRVALRKKVEQHFRRPLEATRTSPKTEKRIRTRKVLKRVELKHSIRILPTVKPQERLALHRDIKDAKKMVPKVMLARKVGYRAAVSEMAKVLTEKHKGKITLMPVVSERTVQSVLQTQPQTKVETSVRGAVSSRVKHENQVRLQPETKKKLFERVKQKVGGKTQPKESEPQSGEKKFYFDSDEKTNGERVKKVIEVAEYLWRNKRPESGAPTGREIAAMVGVDSSLKSEVSRPANIDKSLDVFKEAVAKIEPVEDMNVFRKTIESIMLTALAVRLSLRPSEKVGADAAQKVYGGFLDKKKGHFEEYSNTDGDFKGEKNSVHFVPSSPLPSGEVV